MTRLPRWPFLAALWGVVLLSVLTSCGTVAYRQPTVCETVRQAVKNGSMPVELANAWYPECRATDGPR